MGISGVSGCTWVVRMWCVPMEVAYIPVMIAERAGAQTPDVEKQRVHRQPPAAKRSTFGVRATGSP